MNPNNNYPVSDWEPLLQLMEVRQDVHAVDTTVGPEVEYQQLSFQVAIDTQWDGCVYPWKI